MRIAVMQPYVFPYIGYFQLIGSVEKFVVYDDVAFIKNGWINRNRIKVADKPFTFALPIDKKSPNETILNTKVSRLEYPRWREKFFKTIQSAYSRAPFFQETLGILNRVLVEFPAGISSVATSSICEVCRYLGLPTSIRLTSTVYANSHLRKAERLIDICRKEGGNVYINSIGGMELYQKEYFLERGIELRFIKTGDVKYEQGRHSFIPNLSIVDVLMYNSPDTVRSFLTKCDFV